MMPQSTTHPQNGMDRVGGADEILDCLSFKAKTMSVFVRAHSPQRLIYTTNTIEGFNRQLRKVTK